MAHHNQPSSGTLYKPTVHLPSHPDTFTTFLLTIMAGNTQAWMGFVVVLGMLIRRYERLEDEPQKPTATTTDDKSEVGLDAKPSNWADLDAKTSSWEDLLSVGWGYK